MPHHVIGIDHDDLPLSVQRGQNRRGITGGAAAAVPQDRALNPCGSETSELLLGAAGADDNAFVDDQGGATRPHIGSDGFILLDDIVAPEPLRRWCHRGN